MQIVDLESSNERMVNEVAAILFEAFLHSWTDMDEVLEEVYECLESGRITRVAIDNNGFALGWIGEKSMYGGNVWEMYPLVVSAKSRGWLHIGLSKGKFSSADCSQAGCWTFGGCADGTCHWCGR